VIKPAVLSVAPERRKKRPFDFVMPGGSVVSRVVGAGVGREVFLQPLELVGRHLVGGEAEVSAGRREIGANVDACGLEIDESARLCGHVRSVGDDDRAFVVFDGERVEAIEVHEIGGEHDLVSAGRIQRCRISKFIGIERSGRCLTNRGIENDMRWFGRKALGQERAAHVDEFFAGEGELQLAGGRQVRLAGGVTQLMRARDRVPAKVAIDRHRGSADGDGAAGAPRDVGRLVVSAVQIENGFE